VVFFLYEVDFLITFSYIYNI